MFTKEDLQELIGHATVFMGIVHGALMDVSPKDADLRQALASTTSIEEMDRKAILTNITELQERIWRSIEGAVLKKSQDLFQSIRDAADKSDAGSINRGIDALRSLLNLQSPSAESHPLFPVYQAAADLQKQEERFAALRNRNRPNPQSFMQAVSHVYDIALGGHFDSETLCEAYRIDEACRTFVQERNARILALLRKKHAELIPECRQVKDSLTPLEAKINKLNRELVQAQAISDAFRNAMRASESREPLPQHYPTAGELAAWREEVKKAEEAFIFDRRKMMNIQADRDLARAELEGAKAKMEQLAAKELEWRKVIERLSPADTSNTQSKIPAVFFV